MIAYWLYSHSSNFTLKNSPETWISINDVHKRDFNFRQCHWTTLICECSVLNLKFTRGQFPSKTYTREILYKNEAIIIIIIARIVRGCIIYLKGNARKIVFRTCYWRDVKTRNTDRQKGEISRGIFYRRKFSKKDGKRNAYRGKSGWRTSLLFLMYYEWTPYDTLRARGEASSLLMELCMI